MLSVMWPLFKKKKNEYQILFGKTQKIRHLIHSEVYGNKIKN